MSEKFGLDWKKYDTKRIQYLIAVQNAIHEREEIERRLKKSNKK